jgi:hypothetical protein
MAAHFYSIVNSIDPSGLGQIRVDPRVKMEGRVQRQIEGQETSGDAIIDAD